MFLKQTKTLFYKFKIIIKNIISNNNCL